MLAVHTPQRILGCPICGYRVDPKDHNCPRCGSEFYEGTKFECPFCGGLVSSNSKFCPNCRVDYGDFGERTTAKVSEDSIDALLTEIIGLESSQVKAEAKRYSCPNCSWMLEGSERICPRCKHDLVVDLSFQCPVCGTIVGSSAKVCPECGANFEEAEEVEEAPEQKLEIPPPKEKVQAREPPPEPLKEVKPIVIVKPPHKVARPPERAPEPIPAPAEPVVETPEPEPAPSKPEDTLADLERHLEAEAEIDRTSEQLAAMATQPAKKGTKRRKLKAKPKG